MNENLVSREMVGFRFEDKKHSGICFPSDMEKLIGQVGIIKSVCEYSAHVAFGYSNYYYPIELVRKNLANKEIKHGPVTTQKVTNDIWVAKTVSFEILRAEIEIKGSSEYNAFSKLMNFIEASQMPESIETSPNGDKIYKFKN